MRLKTLRKERPAFENEGNYLIEILRKLFIKYSQVLSSMVIEWIYQLMDLKH
jgi:hypothetical protein